MMIRTMMAAFPHVSLWIPNRMEGVAIGSMQPLKVDMGEWRRRMSVPALGDDLASIGIRSPEDLAATFVAADRALAGFMGDGPLVTDDRPRIEYFNLYPVDPMGYDDITEHLEPIDNYLTELPADVAALRTAERSSTRSGGSMRPERQTVRAKHAIFLEAALRRDADNAYLRYLRATHARDVATRSPGSSERLIR